MPMSNPEPVPFDSLQIDRSSPVPIYQQLVQKLTRLILSGALTPGQRVPSETELANALGISPMTARQALSTLEQNGLIRRQRGVGSFVMTRLFDRPLDQIVGFTQDMTDRGIEATSRILRFEQVPAPQSAVDTGVIEPGTPMLRVKRLRLANLQPVAVQDAYFLGVQFAREELEKSRSVYKILHAQGIHPVRGEEWIEAVAAQAEESHLLDVPVQSPMMRMRLLTWTADDAVVEYSVAMFRADLYQFHAKVGEW
ncbi:MAG: GntR family transcriptional regulator [Anaerolineae bacterium]